ncbi:MAG: phosphomannomutase/phosphoglucomutase, partial [Candidatus Jorgensenbacteria bacterium]
MRNRSIFKAYDIRGIYPSEVNEEVAFLIGRGLGRFFGKKNKPKIVVARDGRIGSPELCEGLKGGLKNRSPKIEIIDIGLATAPMLYVLVQLLKATGGVIATASHNPKEW